MATLTDAPLTQIAERLREATLPYMGCSALMIFTEDCTGRPQKTAGAKEVITRVSIAELDAVRATLSDEKPWFGKAEVAGEPRSVLALKHTPSRALLVLTDPHAAGAAHDAALNWVTYLWGIVARRIQEKVADAPPSYLLESRAASAERVRVTAELTDLHSTTLETILAALRSTSLSDAGARSTVTDLAVKALVQLRTVSHRTTEAVQEPVAKAFERLREDLRPLTRFSGIEVEFIEPPLNGRALPGEVAHAARAIVRGLVLAMLEQPDLSRIRTQWDCDGENLLINIRDDGSGTLSVDAPAIGRLDSRVQALKGRLQIEVMPGWGADVFIT
ncbi:MAG TPA: LuxR family transcriptional regulator, partial [Sinomonas sp.]|nr:LuxR family transcriptional regulator [Sinomonas sp.]